MLATGVGSDLLEDQSRHRAYHCQPKAKREPLSATMRLQTGTDLYHSESFRRPVDVSVGARFTRPELNKRVK